jgi:hypothetical protein
MDSMLTEGEAIMRVAPAAAAFVNRGDGFVPGATTV